MSFSMIGGTRKEKFPHLVPCGISWRDKRGWKIRSGAFCRVYRGTRSDPDSIVFLLLSCREKKFEEIYSGNKCKLLSFERNLSYASLVINSSLSPVFCCYSNGDREGKDAG